MYDHSLADIILAFIIYFVPSLISCARRHHQWLAIGALNFFLGWTILGWILCLVWALTAVRKDPVAVIQPETRPDKKTTPEYLKNWAGRQPETDEKPTSIRPDPNDRV